MTDTSVSTSQLFLRRKNLSYDIFYHHILYYIAYQMDFSEAVQVFHSNQHVKKISEFDLFVVSP